MKDFKYKTTEELELYMKAHNDLIGRRFISLMYRSDYEVYVGWRKMLLKKDSHRRVTKYKQYLLLIARLQYYYYNTGTYWDKFDLATAGFEKYKNKSLR